MIAGKHIGEMVELFTKRNVSLYHACQYEDFTSYLRLGGVPSRNLLESSDSRYTRFETDHLDQVNKVWDKVFFNLSDFGKTFSDGGRGVPNPYGPILLRISPSALNNSEDVAICLRSAGAVGFDRYRESIRSIEDVGRLFTSKLSGHRDRLNWVKFSTELQTEFNYPKAASPEISCSVGSGIIPISFVDELLVDPYVIAGSSLTKNVNDVVSKSSIRVPVHTRKSKIGATAYRLLGEFVLGEGLTLIEFLEDKGSSELKNWATKIADINLAYQFDRYAKYLREGTIVPVLDQVLSE